jgi:hypothetical protein
MKTSKEYERFDRVMEQLLKVPHSEIKAKLDAEKAEKQRRKKAAKKSIVSRVSRDSGGGSE